MQETRMRLPVRSRAISIGLSVVASLALAGWAAADTVELAPSKDNTLIETPVGNSNGSGDGIYAGKVGLNGSNTRRRGLLAFDLSSIPAGATVDAATLALEMANSPNGTARLVTLHRVTADWGQAGSVGGGSGGLAQPGDATWQLRFFDTDPWATPGGDFVGAASASQSVGQIGPYEWTGAGLVADLQFWLDSPASNFGWLVMGNEDSASTVKKFYSSEGFIPPRLSVNYTPSLIGVLPQPGAEAAWFAPPWPTPASGRVNLSYTLPRAARVTLSIHDAMGRVVRRVVTDRVEPAGRHATVWDGRTDAGTDAASGVYLASLVVDGIRLQRRVALLR